jgi:CDP-glucose 4,6-dehydratase
MGERQGALESVGMNPAFWQGKRVFLTGHTGFKGSWLSLWLQNLGTELTGYALAPPTQPSLFEIANVGNEMLSVIGDIRNPSELRSAMQAAQPEIVIHMAAQALVRQSYLDPLETYATNVMGTVHLLEAVRQTPGVKAVVIVTSDKCYENKEWEWGYRENEPMGGHDPYSSSKGCAELVASAYRRSFLQSQGVAVATARAGNVIGGGDWAADRLIPDVLRAFKRNQPVVIRNPHATRPWQHVLEPLSGYLTLAEHLFEHGAEFAEGWNFGPHDHDARPVQWIVEELVGRWGQGARFELDAGTHPHEAHFLKLDISKAKARLRWAPRWTVAFSLGKVVEWHNALAANEDMRAFTLEQISSYHQGVGL